MASQPLQSTSADMPQPLEGKVKELTINDLAELENALHRIAHISVAFGLQLGVENHRMQAIEAQHTSPYDRLREALRCRLRQLPLLTWHDVILALRSNIVQEYQLASELESRYVHRSPLTASPQASATHVLTHAPLQPTLGNHSAGMLPQSTTPLPPLSLQSFIHTTPHPPYPGPSRQQFVHHQRQQKLLPQLPTPFHYPSGETFSLLASSNQSALGVPRQQQPPSHQWTASTTPTGRTDELFTAHPSYGQYNTLPTHLLPHYEFPTFGAGLYNMYPHPPYYHPMPSSQLQHGHIPLPLCPQNLPYPPQQPHTSHQLHPPHQLQPSYQPHPPHQLQPSHQPRPPHQLQPSHQPRPPHQPHQPFLTNQLQRSHQPRSTNQQQLPPVLSSNISSPYVQLHPHTHQHMHHTPHPFSHDHGSYSDSGPPQPRKTYDDPLVAQYISYVKTIYKSREVERYLKATKWPPTPSKVFINLACIDRKTVVAKQEADEITQCMVRDGSVDVILKKKKPIDFSDIARDLPDTAEQRLILVEGAPGVGKSTFAWEYCRRWEKGKIAKQYQLVLLLRLRDVKITGAQSLADLIYHPVRDVCQAVERELVSAYGDNTLIILEGFDELSDTSRAQSSIFLQLIHGQLLPLATVLVTSRPWATQDLHRKCSYRIFQHIEILGFTGTQIEEYVASVFRGEGKPANDMAMENTKEVMAYINIYPQIKACMYIPLNSAIVVSMHQESKAGRCILPKTLTQLYYALTQTLLLRYLYGHPEYGQRKWKIQSFKKDLPQDVYRQLLAISELAYSGICTDQGDSVQLIFSNLPPNFEKLGLMQSVSQLYGTQSEDVSCNFLNLTVQEYLAALHISNMSPEKQLEHFQRQEEGRLRVVLRFLAGITELAVSAEALRVLLLKEPNEDQITNGNKYSITADVVLSSQHVHWMFETQRDDIVHLVLQAKTVEFIGSRGLTALDYYSLGYCIAHSHSQWVLQIEEVIEKVEVKMLVAGFYTTAARVVGMKGGKRDKDDSGGYFPLSISAEAQNLMFTGLQDVFHLQEFHLVLPVECCYITWPDLSGLRVLHLAISGYRSWRLDALLPHLLLDSLTIEPTSDGNTLVHEDCVAIGKLLSSSDCLKFLHFPMVVDSGCLHVDYQGMESITKAMSDNERLPLRSLVVQCTCTFSDTTSHSLALFITRSTTLHHLSIVRCAFSAHRLLEMAQAIHHSSSLQERTLEDLECTVVGDYEATVNAQLLVDYPYMMNCLAKVIASHISVEGLQSIATVLRHSSALRMLDLSNNGISDKGAAVLAQALHHNSTVEEVDLSDNRVSDEGLAALVGALQHTSALKKLNLSGNCISEAGAATLAQLSPSYHVLLNEENDELQNRDNTIKKKRQRQLLDKALEEGSIETGLDVLLFIGAAGSGKTHYKHLCLGLPPPEVRDSTGLAEPPVRTMSLARGAVKQLPQNGEERDYYWQEVSEELFKELIAEAMAEDEVKNEHDSAAVTQKSNATAGSQTPDIEHDRGNTEHESSIQEENIVHNREAEALELDQMTSENNTSTQNERPAFSRQEHYRSSFYYQLLDALRKRKSLSPSEKSQVKLPDANLIYIVDSGGQPQFREMLPILVQMATACVLTLKLNEPLVKPNEVECFGKGKELCRPYLSVLTNEQVVKHCSQIVDSQTKDCKLFIVGTHRDLEGECETESRAEKNEKLSKLLRTQLGDKLEEYIIGELIYPVDCKDPKDEDREVVQQFRNAVHGIQEASCKEPVKVPLHWFLLELLLHQLARKSRETIDFKGDVKEDAKSGILSFEGCKQAAIDQLKMSEEVFSTAVEFLAKNLGTILYFPRVLPNIIFTPQALMNILSEIVKTRHLLNSNPWPRNYQKQKRKWSNFQKFGMIDKILLQTASLKAFFSDLFVPDDFLELMKELLIAASISDTKYLFPSVLEELPPKKVQEKIVKACECLAPLVLHCSSTTVDCIVKENWLPVGSFTSLVAQLLNVNKWTLRMDEKGEPFCLYRNCIQLTTSDRLGVVTLVDQFKHMEVYLQVDLKSLKRTSRCVGSTVYRELKAVCTRLKCNKKIQETFFCPHNNIAILHWFDSMEQGCKCERDDCTSRKLTEKQWPWLQDISAGQNLQPTLAELEDALTTVAHKCVLLGDQLGVEDHRLKTIQRDYSNSCEQLREILCYRLTQLPPLTWHDIIRALRSNSVHENKLANEIESQHSN